uniref:RCC1-like domain-containing protein n=1 Tax=Oryza glumipatula TaxID=40148 RepID=A0A0D9YFR5_9ORYZ
MEKAAAAAVTAAAAAAAEEEEEEEEAVWAWSWGAGTDGQLGNGGFQDHHLPQPLLLPPRCRGRVSFVAGGGAHAIALTSNGEVFTWGRGTHGQLGHGDVENIPHPKLVKFFENYMITCVSAGWNHSGFATDSGQLFMCGDGSFGQLGAGDNHPRNLPFEVAYFTTKHVVRLALGMRHSLVLLKDNSVYGFGSARRGQIGRCARNQKFYDVPRIIDGFSDCKIGNIYANGDHSAALDESGQLYIWGRALIGEHDDDQPRPVFPSLSISQVALGWHHALVLSESSSSTLVKVPCVDGEQVVHIAAGTEHSASVTDKGTVFTWGWGEHGQLGLGDTCDQVTPQRVNIGDKRPYSSASVNVYCGSGFTIAVNSGLESD